MTINIRNQEPVEKESFRISVKDREYQIKECAEGFQIIEITDKEILVRPQYANSITIK